MPLADSEKDYLVAEIDRLRAALNRVQVPARALVMSSTPFISALELAPGADGEALHRALREALEITEAEWLDSPER